ncbi:MAG: hypothetical protein AAGE94_11120 [Acidobacteriota bacterium]
MASDLPRSASNRHASTPSPPPVRRRRDERVAVVATLLLYLVLLTPAPPDEDRPSRWELPDGTDKVIHTGLFAAETYWLERAARHHLAPTPALGSAVATSLVIAWSTEVLQGAVPGRQNDPADLAADAAGVVIAALAIGLRRA